MEIKDQDNHYQTKKSEIEIICRKCSLGFGSILHCDGIYGKGLILASYLEKLNSDNPELFTNKNIVELGSGCGLPGIVCSLLGTRSNSKILQPRRHCYIH